MKLVRPSSCQSTEVDNCEAIDHKAPDIPIYSDPDVTPISANVTLECDRAAYNDDDEEAIATEWDIWTVENLDVPDTVITPIIICTGTP